MSLVYAAYVGVPFVSIPVNAGLAAWIYAHHRDVPGSRWFVATLGLGAIWMVSATLEIALPTYEQQILAATVSTKLAILAFLAYTVFASLYTRTHFHRHWLFMFLAGVAVALIVLPTWVEPIESLFYADWNEYPSPFQYVTPAPGPLYPMVAILTAVLTAYTLYVLVRYMLSTGRRSGAQLALLVVGSLSLAIVVLLGNLNVVFPLEGVVNARFGSLPFAVLTSLALFRFRLFEMQPVARNVVVENLHDPVLVLDTDRTLVDYNDASASVWRAVDGGSGRPLNQVCPTVAEEVSLENGDITTSGNLSVLVDGQRRHYSIEVSTVGDRDDPDLYAILLRDVTDLEQSRWQLERQNERLDQVAATISHDLRNPINIAAGYAQSVDQRLAPDLGPDEVASARDDLDRVQGALDRMEDIIDDVLTLAREGQTVAETESLSLATVAREAWGNVETADATLDVAGDRQLAADESKLLTLLENLYRNAVEHVGEDVTVTAGAMEDGFFVADDGPGIPAGEAEDVFEYGYTSADGGTGLGLSIVRTIAESHGWTVELDTSADGARFVFRNVDQADDG